MDLHGQACPVEGLHHSQYNHQHLQSISVRLNKDFSDYQGQHTRVIVHIHFFFNIRVSWFRLAIILRRLSNAGCRVESNALYVEILLSRSTSVSLEQSSSQSEHCPACPHPSRLRTRLRRTSRQLASDPYICGVQHALAQG